MATASESIVGHLNPIERAVVRRGDLLQKTAEGHRPSKAGTKDDYFAPFSVFPFFSRSDRIMSRFLRAAA